MSASVAPTSTTPGEFAPRPGRAPLGRMALAQVWMELKLLLRNGEQVMLSLIVPIGLLVAFTQIPFIEVDGERADFFVPGVLALAVMSSAFTGQAIATGFDRQYGVLKRLGATPLPRSVLLMGKTGAVLVVELLQVALLVLVGVLLGWHPQGDPFSVVLLLAFGTAAFCGLAFLMAGVLRAMATLALANILWFVLLVLGGIMYPLSDLGSAAGAVEALPSAALADGLRDVLQHGHVAPFHDLIVLGLWAVVSLTAAAATFRWE
ncbi:ABC transporter permease [Patulibacter sp. SYSU D01012]|uniref:ABC transporter permease n=1 Tax=Patulibacter sp. SYSU D01012 TaxID=2817381 RepID=UPI001B303E01|nr:ABC transporter permease [Patulibacter sp. SYSU D01012]